MVDVGVERVREEVKGGLREMFQFCGMEWLHLQVAAIDRLSMSPLRLVAIVQWGSAA